MYNKIISVLLFIVQGIVAQSIIICDCTSKNINCPAGQKLHIISAQYKFVTTDKNICTNQTNQVNNGKNCTSDVTFDIGISCNNQRNCTLTANTAIFGHLCTARIGNYLSVTYNCQYVSNSTEVYYGCGLNTYRVYCAPGCQETCFSTFIVNCNQPCIPYGCRCRDGYYRDPYDLNHCLKNNLCPQPGNNTNEIFSPNRADCQARCGRSSINITNCMNKCEKAENCQAGYICAQGYYRLGTCWFFNIGSSNICVKTCPKCNIK